MSRITLLSSTIRSRFVTAWRESTIGASVRSAILARSADLRRATVSRERSVRAARAVAERLRALPTRIR
jgi:hypothetical protein